METGTGGKGKLHISFSMVSEIKILIFKTLC